jgi:hypothetical protein
MGLAESCGYVPVNPADVVAWLVGPNFSGFRAVTRRQSTMVSLEQSIEPTSHTDFEAAENLRGGGAVY